jgi:hypothetical protein
MCEVKTRGHRIKAQGKITNGSRLKGQGSIASGLRLEVRGQKSRVRSEVRVWRQIKHGQINCGFWILDCGILISHPS